MISCEECGGELTNEEQKATELDGFCNLCYSKYLDFERMNGYLG